MAGEPVEVDEQPEHGSAEVRLLFVCTANRVRSPLAEAFTASAAAEHGLAIQVGSAGFLDEGLPAIDRMADVARKMGLDLSEHHSRTVDADVIGSADLIVAMTGQHVIDLVGIDPSASRRILTLREWAAAATDRPPHPWTPASVRTVTAGVTARPLAALLGGQLDVADPIGGPRRAYQRAASEITELLRTALHLPPA